MRAARPPLVAAVRARLPDYGLLIAGFLLGLTPYLLPVVRFLQGGGPYYWGAPEDWGAFWRLVTDQDFRPLVFGVPWSQFGARVVWGAGILLDQYGWPGVLIGLAGWVVLARRQPLVFLMLACGWVLSFVSGIMYASETSYYHSSPATCCGRWRWAWRARRRWAGSRRARGRRTTDDGRRTTDDGRRTTDDGRRTTDDGRRTTDDGRRTIGLRVRTGRRTTDDGRRTIMACKIGGGDCALRAAWSCWRGCWCWLGAALVDRYPRLDRSYDTWARDQGAATLQALAPNAVVFARWEATTILRYYQLVEGRRLDVALQAGNPADWAGQIHDWLMEGRAVYVNLPPDAVRQQFRLTPAALVERVEFPP